MLVATRCLVSAFVAVAVAVAGLACSPVTRTYEGVGGQGGGGTGGEVGGASSTASSSPTSGSSSSGMCAGTEDCFNGVDDDCNGTTDCEDAACGGVAVCAPELDGAPSGVVVPGTDACPGGYTAKEQIIHRGLVDGGCTGCLCKVQSPVCTGDVWYYPTSAECTGSIGLTGGKLAGNFDAACSPNPISSSQIYGVRTSAWKMKESCATGGAPMLAPAAWGETMKFCQADKVGKGCSVGNTCVPSVAAAPHCALAAGSSACGGFATSQSDWYTGVTDTRACGACGCSASGGSCGPVVLNVGSDYTCGANAVVGESAKQCFSGSGIYAPPVQLAGKPKLGTCTPDAAVTGSLDGIGQSTLCCQP